MHIHILGICGTFMGGIALLARAAGHEVSGSDTNVYPPMSTQLEAQGISLMEGYEAAHLEPAPDCVVVGNVMSRGNPVIEYMLERNIPYTSGPQWLAEHILRERWVLAVAGTHGKTTTSSMLAWILEYAGLAPGFLIGGVPENFGVSARFGNAPFFVVEADEYDTAFFDKRSKFVHYRPRTLILNNLEFDHADIFPDLAAIQRQFHHLLRTVPGNGLIISNGDEANLDAVLSQGCWTPVESFGESRSTYAGAHWGMKNIKDAGASFDVLLNDIRQGTVGWSLAGRHNIYNAIAALAAARHAGVPLATAIDAMQAYKNVKRRMEVRAEIGGVTVYDDFAHHPTAIKATLSALRDMAGKQRVIAVLEPRSNTMRMGVHKDELAASLLDADEVLILQPQDIKWDVQQVTAALDAHATAYISVDAMVDALTAMATQGDHIVIMSNGAFGGIHQKLIHVLESSSG